MKRKRCNVAAAKDSKPKGTMPPRLDEDSETERVQIVAPSSWVRRVEEWRRAQPKIPNRSDAIRQLVDAGLVAIKKAGKR